MLLSNNAKRSSKTSKRSKYSSSSKMRAKKYDKATYKTPSNLRYRNAYVETWLNVAPQNAANAFAAFPQISSVNGSDNKPTFLTLASQVTSTEFTSYANLYDQYRIMQICMEFIPLCIPVNSNTGGQFTNLTDGTLYVIVDYNDSAVIASKDSLFDYPSIKIIPMGKPSVTKICYTPRVLEAVYNTAGAAVAGANSIAPWISTSQSAIAHYGVKCFVGQSNNTLAPPVQCWQIKISAKFAFKSQN